MNKYQDENSMKSWSTNFISTITTQPKFSAECLVVL